VRREHCTRSKNIGAGHPLLPRHFLTGPPRQRMYLTFTLKALG
jgi:hypothetical protein